MGFFDTLRKIVQGKPVFEPPQNQSKTGAVTGGVSASSAPQPSITRPVGPKVHPRLEVGRVQCSLSGDDMELEVEIRNASNEQLDLDQAWVLGTSHDLGTYLRPGEEREFKLYSGDRPHSTGNSRVDITFRTMPGGDYFQAEFVLDFKKEADGTYSVFRMRPIQVRDI